jgi:ubiquinone/menaquinone biosynthesis C-methylase UbiE
MTFISQDHAAISNLRVFERERTVKDYRAYTGLQQAELAIISQIKAELSGKKILDVGVGAGRTTDALLEISKDYLGIDISLPMIQTCRSRFPSASFEVCDVRDLSRFGDRAFDLLFFSHNGLDYVGHADRLRALGEIHRVLMEAGVFAFSSHNRRSMRKAPWHSAQLPWRMNPLRHPRRYSKRLFEAVMETFNHLYNRRYERYNDEFAVINDSGHHYTLLTYYIDIDTQIRQLKGVGFQKIEAVDLNGNWLTEDHYARCKDPWIYYLCRKI